MRWLYAIPSVRYGRAQQGDGAQQVSGADVGTDFTGRCRGVEQRAEGGFESLEEVAGQGVERRVARVKGGGQSSLGREELGVPVERVRERPSRLVRCGQCRGRVGAGVYLVLEHGLDQVRALREMPVQRPDSDAGQVGDLLRGRVHARGAEDGLRRRKQGADVALRVGAQLARRSLGCARSRGASRASCGRRRVLRHDTPSTCFPEELSI